MGETDSLNPSKKDEIRFWYSHRILEMKHDVKIFSAISPMRQGRKVHVCEADGKSFLLAFNRPVLFLEKVEGIRKQEQKRTALYLFLYVFLVSLYLLSLIFFFPFLFSQVGQGLDGASSVGNSRRRRNVQKLGFIFLLLF